MLKFEDANAFYKIVSQRTDEINQVVKRVLQSVKVNCFRSEHKARKWEECTDWKHNIRKS